MIETFKNHPAIKAFYSTRHDGHSQKPFSSLNLGFHVGDNPTHVAQNHELIRSEFGESSEIVMMNQVHSHTICETGNFHGIPECDALMSDDKDKILMVMVADCVPLLFYDSKNRAIAAIHAGRAGVFENIVSETFNAMQRRFKTKKENLFISMGPHIGACCYEVGVEIVNEAKALHAKKYIIEKSGKYFLDMRGFLHAQFEAIGVKKENIQEHTFCTACHTQNFFSYRKEKKTGRFCAVIMLK